jgi:hypothetical protein
MKQYNINVPFRSGCDDESAYNILNGIEESASDYESFKLLKEDTKCSIATKKRRQRQRRGSSFSINW